MLDILREYDVVGAFVTTLELAALSACGALLIGTLVAIMRISPVGVWRVIGSVYVTVFRNTPLTLLMFFSIAGATYILGLPLSADTSTNIFRWAVVVLSLYHAAFVCESLRSGINTVPIGQAEAARALGLTFNQSLRDIVLPQAWRGSIAPLGTNMVALVKNTTVAAVIGGAEAAGLLSQIIENETGTLTVFFVFAAGFVAITLPIGLITTALSRSMVVKR
jgi:glutamate transport system permease protein